MSPRKRKNPADDWMPPRVYRGRSAYEWHPKGGGAVKLCPLDAPHDTVLSEYRKAKEERTQASRVTIGSMLDEYLHSADFRRLAAATQNDYRYSSGKLRRVFGDAAPDAVTAPIVRQFMDKRGEKSITRANRELSLLSTIWAWSFERGHTSAPNPCKAVRRFQEKRRDKYVTDAEYQSVYERAPLHIQIAMEIAYLCAARQADVLALRWGRPGQTDPQSNQGPTVLEQGIYIRQGKTGRKKTKLWTPRLRAAIEKAKRLRSDISSVYVIHNRKGQRYTADGFKAMWKRVRDKALEDGAIAESFTFHDLKAKGISDYEGDKLAFSDHASRQQMERYNRKVQEIHAHDPDKSE